MRRLIALAVMSATVCATGATAETWKPYTGVSDKGLQWSYDTDYSYRDAQSGRVVVMQAIGKAGAAPRMGPSAPGAADGVGQVMGVDCEVRGVVLIGSYSPSKPLALSDSWRNAPAKRADGADDRALVAAVCAIASQLPSK